MRASRKRRRPARDDHADVDELAALDARHDADDRVVIRCSDRARIGLLDECARRFEPARAGSRVGVAVRRHVGERGVVAEPVVGNRARRCASITSGVSAARHRRVDLARARVASGSSTWSLISGTGSPARSTIVVRRVVEVERRAVVDQPEPVVPHQHVGVARRAVDVGDVGVEPDDRARRASASGCSASGSNVDRARQVVERQVEPGAVRSDQVLDLGVGLGAREVGIELDEDDLGHRQAERRARSRRRPARRSAPSGPGRRRGTSATYRPSSSASTIAGSEPPSRSGVT